MIEFCTKKQKPKAIRESRENPCFFTRNADIISPPRLGRPVPRSHGHHSSRQSVPEPVLNRRRPPGYFRSPFPLLLFPCAHFRYKEVMLLVVWVVGL